MVEVAVVEGCRCRRHDVLVEIDALVILAVVIRAETTGASITHKLIDKAIITFVYSVKRDFRHDDHR